jgi:hypothetical protein
MTMAQFGALLDYWLAFGLVRQYGKRSGARYGARVADILTGAACPCALYSAAMVIKLQGNTDRFCARPCGKGRYYRRINATRHSDDDSLAA